MGVSAFGNITSCHFEHNSVLAPVAVGGAVIVAEGGIVIIDQVSMASNTATASGDCFLTYDSNVRCTASFGGAIVAAIGSELDITNSSFRQNSARCIDARYCNVNGGAISLTKLGTIIVSSSECTSNHVLCESVADCMRGAGGCFYG